jgi:hypothetical protein
VTAVAPFQRRLERCRRRLRSISIAQHVLMAMPVALLAAAVVVALGRVPRDVAWFASGAALALSAAAGVWLGIRRTPSLAAVATAVDRRLGLQDATVTALECIGAADPMSTLVVRNANALTDGIAPATLFSFSLLRYTRPVAVAALGMAVLATIRTSETGAWSNGDGMRIPTGTTDASKAIAGGGAQAPSAPVARTEPRPGATTAPAGIQPEPGADRSAAADRSPASAVQESAQHSVAPRAEDTLTRGSAARLDKSGAARRGDAASGASRAGSDGRGGAAAAREGGRGGSTPGEGDARGAGGVRGQRTGGNLPLPALAPASESYASRYELAARRAEEALNEGRVPPHLRGYVRRYFNGIRPDQHR